MLFKVCPIIAMSVPTKITAVFTEVKLRVLGDIDAMQSDHLDMTYEVVVPNAGNGSPDVSNLRKRDLISELYSVLEIDPLHLYLDDAGIQFIKTYRYHDSDVQKYILPEIEMNGGPTPIILPIVPFIFAYYAAQIPYNAVVNTLGYFKYATHNPKMDLFRVYVAMRKSHVECEPYK